MLTVSCPHCGFAKNVPPDKIPAGVVKVTCPSCEETFPFGRNAADTPDPTEDENSAGDEEISLSATAALPKAGFWIRVAAALVDGIILLVVQVILSILLGLIAVSVGSGVNAQGQAALSLVYTLFGTALSMAYYVFFTGYSGQTPGKMAVRIKVIRVDGEEIGFGRAFFREVLGKFVSGIILGIGYLMVAFDSQKQGLHDRIASTYVIKL
ncbi:MAG: hypothetical protein C0623_04575 [Desulfuromonas sp.]|nr:MAG: hypothetical protein C0623_04575 [Desulfuromonas sp.]